MLPFTAKDVLKAYRKNALTTLPCAGAWVQHQGRCLCPVSIMIRERYPDKFQEWIDDESMRQDRAAFLFGGLSPNEVHAFVDGFDVIDSSIEKYRKHGAYLQDYILGLETRELLADKLIYPCDFTTDAVRRKITSPLPVFTRRIDQS